MVDFRAFRAWRPRPDVAAQVAAVPYDVVDTAEARALAAGNPLSLLHVTRPDVDLPDGTSMYADEAYTAAARAFAALIADGVLQHDDSRGLYVYAQQMGDHRQIGLVGTASAADYRAGLIKRHEHTRPQKEDDRTRHVEAVRAHLGPVFLAFRARPDLDALIEGCVRATPEVDFVGHDGVRHTLWPVFDPATVHAIEAAFSQVPALYIADGHHRAAAAARVGAGASADDARGRFLAVAFPDDRLRILPYNRVVADRNDRSVESLIVALADRFEVTQLTGPAAPDRPQSFTMFLGGRWHRLDLKPAAAPDRDDPVARLDVSVLQDQVLEPLLGIGDPRTDERIDFVGGIRGLAELEARAGTDGVAFALYPTSLADLMAIADAGEVMPPKSTWFEPKLRSGLVISRY